MAKKQKKDRVELPMISFYILLKHIESLNQRVLVLEKAVNDLKKNKIV